MSILMLGISIGSIKSFLKETQYVSKITIASPFIDGEIVVDLINNIGSFIEEKDYIAQRLKLTGDISTLLKGIDAQLVKEFDGKNFVKTDRIHLKIYVSTRNKELIDTVFSNLLQAIKENHFIQEQIKQERARIEQLKTELTKKIDELEELQEESFRQIKVTEEVLSYYEPVVSLLNDRVKLDRELQNIKVYLIIDNDTFPTLVQKNHVSTILPYALWPSLVWMLVLIAIAFFKTMDQDIFFE